MDEPVNVYGSDAMKLRTVQEWRKRFREGRTSTDDDDRSGSPVTATGEDEIEAVREAIQLCPKSTLKVLESRASVEFFRRNSDIPKSVQGGFLIS